MRRLSRAIVLAAALMRCIVNLWIARLRGKFTPERQALWVQSCGKLLMSAMGIHSNVKGKAPDRGLLVANHLSYLDIVILAAAAPCCFVAKIQIASWPLFGMLARAAGTMFVDRASKQSAEKVTAQVAERLKQPVPVLFFPEGTSSDGSTVQRFHSRLFDPAVVAGALVTAASVRYIMQDGTPERELCWFGDDAFVPHLWKVLGAAGFTAEVEIGEPRVYHDRRYAADATQAEIEAMRAGQVAALQ